jgi:hypothetical protein
MCRINTGGDFTTRARVGRNLTRREVRVTKWQKACIVLRPFSSPRTTELAFSKNHATVSVYQISDVFVAIYGRVQQVDVYRDQYEPGRCVEHTVT